MAFHLYAFADEPIPHKKSQKAQKSGLTSQTFLLRKFCFNLCDMHRLVATYAQIVALAKCLATYRTFVTSNSVENYSFCCSHCRCCDNCIRQKSCSIMINIFLRRRVLFFTIRELLDFVQSTILLPLRPQPTDKIVPRAGPRA